MTGYPSGIPPRFDVDAAPDRGDGKAFLRAYTLHLDEARQDFEIGLGGVFLWAFDTVGTTAEITVKYNAPTGDGIPFRRGTKIAGVPFGSLWISHTAQPGSRVTLIISNRIMETDNAVGISSLVEVEQANTLSAAKHIISAAPGSAVQIGAPNATRKSFLVYADPTNTGRVFIVADAASGGGFPLVAGAAVEMTHTQGIWVYRDSGFQTIYALAETRV